MVVYIIQQRSKTHCKTEKSHNDASHCTNRSHTGDNERIESLKPNCKVGCSLKYSILDKIPL